jgi:signal transduction histidine kinase
LQLIDEQILTQQQFSDVSAKLQVQLKVLTESLEDVLHWSKMQLNGTMEKAETQNLVQVIGEIMPMFEYALDGKNICLKNKIGNNIEAYAARDHLKLIFRNLLSNAIKFSYPGGCIFMDALLVGNKVVINVRDDGTGIKNTVLHQLNEEKLNFTSNVGTASEKGTGLGLMLVREFLQKNNGTLTIYSEEGKGSTFTIILPGTQH